MKRIYTWITLSAVITLAILLRFWQLGMVPPSPDWDEAALGYNAYSILKTGKDEYGTFMPLSLQSFNDYKPPLYVYLAVPAVKLFGLTIWAVRLPSAIAGVLAVIGVYFLVRLLIRHARDTSGNGAELLGLGRNIIDALPIISAFMLAISPWHIQFSRVAFEANVGLTINIWAAYFFLRGFYTRSGFTISAVLFALALYVYHSERVFVPGLVLFLLIIYRKQIWPERKMAVIVAIIAGFLALVPLIPVLLNKNTVTRLRGTSSFREQTALLSTSIKKLEYDNARGDVIGKVFDNRRVDYAKTIISGYLVHFSPKWLFVTGDHERHHAPDMGLLYLWEFPFIMIGIFRLVSSKKPANVFFLGWMLLAPIAASPTEQIPHAIRTLVFLPTFQVFTSIGLLAVYSFIRSMAYRWKIPIIICVSTVILVSFVYYVHMYFVHMNTEYSQFWQYGYKQAVEYAEAHSSEYEKIIVSTDLEQPYMFFLFYSRMDPANYLSQGGTVSGSFDELNNHFNKYEFRKIDWPSEVKDGKTLFIGTPAEIVHGTKANIPFLNGLPAISITDRE